MIRKLKQHREMLGLTQFELAKDSGVSVMRIAYAESGRTKYRADEVQRIKRVLRKRVREIVSQVEE